MADLTEKFRKHELPKGFYYVQMPNGTFEILSDYALCRYALAKDGDKIKVLELVPSYEEMQELKSERDELAYDLGVADTKNNELLRLLKECNDAFEKIQHNYGYDDSVIELSEPVQLKIKEVLK